MESCATVIVTPVYEDVEACSRLFEELNRQGLDGLTVLAIDDGSVAETLDGNDDPIVYTVSSASSDDSYAPSSTTAWSSHQFADHDE